MATKIENKTDMELIEMGAISICPKCGSDNTRTSPIPGGRNIIICMDCGNRFIRYTRRYAPPG
jgi:NMD protein affecting ribosome stability and mRNA decay